MVDEERELEKKRNFNTYHKMAAEVQCLTT